MASSSTSHKRALSNAEEPLQKKAASGKHITHLSRVGEEDALMSSTLDYRRRCFVEAATNCEASTTFRSLLPRQRMRETR
jgi:hypothetical protein